MRSMFFFDEVQDLMHKFEEAGIKYVEKSPGRTAPYQVQLSSGSIAIVPLSKEMVFVSADVVHFSFPAPSRAI